MCYTLGDLVAHYIASLGSLTTGQTQSLKVDIKQQLSDVDDLEPIIEMIICGDGVGMNDNFRNLLIKMVKGGCKASLHSLILSDLEHVVTRQRQRLPTLRTVSREELLEEMREVAWETQQETERVKHDRYRN